MTFQKTFLIKTIPNNRELKTIKRDRVVETYGFHTDRFAHGAVEVVGTAGKLLVVHVRTARNKTVNSSSKWSGYEFEHLFEEGKQKTFILHTY